MRAERIRAVIVDDEPSAREAVAMLLLGEPEVEIVGVAANAGEAVTVVRETTPDLLFLDIQMPDADGFAVLDALGADTPRGVVFVTAHDEHAIRAFEVHALDYLLKPFGKPRFHAAVARAIERLRALDGSTLQRTLAAIRRIAVRSGSKVTLVDVDAIQWIEAAGDYARVHTADQSNIIDQRMHALEQDLGTRDFIRIHRSAIVRLTSIAELHRESDGGGTIILAGGVRLRVARGRWEALQIALGLG
jgi:two-component system LytT family response regulator